MQIFVKNNLKFLKVSPGPIRLRQCCRNGCLNICLSTAPSQSKSKEFCSQNCMIKSSRRNTVENFELLPAFVAGAGVLSSGKSFWSRTSVENFHTTLHFGATFFVCVSLNTHFGIILHKFVLLDANFCPARAGMNALANVSRFHTLPHNSALAHGRNKKHSADSSTTRDSPPRIPPHQNLPPAPPEPSTR